MLVFDKDVDVHSKRSIWETDLQLSKSVPLRGASKYRNNISAFGCFGWRNGLQSHVNCKERICENVQQKPGCCCNFLDPGFLYFLRTALKLTSDVFGERLIEKTSGDCSEWCSHRYCWPYILSLNRNPRHNVTDTGGGGGIVHWQEIRSILSFINEDA